MMNDDEANEWGHLQAYINDVAKGCYAPMLSSYSWREYATIRKRDLEIRVLNDWYRKVKDEEPKQDIDLGLDLYC